MRSGKDFGLVGRWVLVLIALAVGLGLAVPVLAVDDAPPQRPDDNPSLYLPLVSSLSVSFNSSTQQPVGGVCPLGYHRVGKDSQTGVTASDTYTSPDNEFSCELDEPVAELACGPHGVAQGEDGLARCACAEGYAGEGCNVCATDYSQGVTGACVYDPYIPSVAILGAGVSIERGQELTLTAQSSTSPTFNWVIQDGSGCLKAGPSSPCLGSVLNSLQVIYVPAAVGEVLELVEIKATPTSGGGKPGLGPLVIVAATGIPITGGGDTDLQPLLSAVNDYVINRCVGAALVGVSKYGKQVGIWGLGRKDGRAAIDTIPECGDNTVNPHFPNSPTIKANTPFRLGSVSKSVTMAMVRWTLKEKWNVVHGYYPSDDQIEDIPFVDSQTHDINPGPGVTQLGFSVLPTDLNNIYKGVTPVPVVISAELGGLADPRWKDVTIGDLIGHTTGLPRTAPNWDDYMDQLDEMRGVSSLAQFQAQDAQVETKFGAALVDSGRSLLAVASGQNVNNVFFLKYPTVAEILKLLAGRALIGDPGVEELYSNTGPAMLAVVLEHLHNRPVNATHGFPATHSGSILELFFNHQLSLATSGQTGFYGSHGFDPNLPGEPEASKRNWSTDQNTYHPLVWDSKNPHCFWNGSTCSFSTWVNEANGRLSSTWQLNKVRMPLNAAGAVHTQGAFAAESAVMLKFMSQYWVSGYGLEPRIGESRIKDGKTQWNVHTAHNGAYEGILTWAIQFGKDDEVTFGLAPLSPDGKHVSGSTAEAPTRYSLGPSVTGHIMSFDQYGTTAGAFNADTYALGYGRYDLTGNQILTYALSSGIVRGVNNGGFNYFSFNSNFVEGDTLLIGDVDSDVFDEVIIISPDDNLATAYNTDGSQAWQKAVTAEPGDRWAFGRYSANKRPGFYRGNPATGEVSTFDYNLVATGPVVNLGLRPEDGFAVGDVTGINRAEVLIGRFDTGLVEVYASATDDMNQPTLAQYAVFNPSFKSGGALAVAVVTRGRDRIMVADPINGQVSIYRTDADDDRKITKLFNLETLEDLPIYQPGTFLAAGAPEGGYFTYRCSDTNGQHKGLPEGIDLLVSVNSWPTDRACALHGGLGACSRAMDSLYSVLQYGVCRVDWSKVTPQAQKTLQLNP